MRELIGRIAVTDDDAATALRVIAHFDDLADRGASSSTLLRAAAGLAHAPVGMHHGGTARTVRVDPPGATTSPSGLPDSSWPREVVDRSRAISIWLERSGAPGPLDQLILERCAQALRVSLGAGGRAASLDELMQVVCDPQASEPERSDALEKLGVGEPTIVHSASARVTADGPTAQVDGAWVVLTPAGHSVRGRRPDTRIGSASVHKGDVPTALVNARVAEALSVHPVHGGPSWVVFEELGALADIAGAITPEMARDSSEVRTLELLRAERPWVPQVIQQLAAGATLRAAAQATHVHHSTMQDREAWLEIKLGYQLRTPPGRERATAAWAMWRISGFLHYR
ncbi:hypothetical protein MRBLMI12_001172 [Microbacterium sp. LMI12-1-1.1]|uniref:hypothetical protein n=1 Tax=Microbacterium sp. LMI12-1-1.1 TaxID=3135225 RepID=UPI00341671B8